MHEIGDIVKKAESFVVDYYQNHDEQTLVYHNIDHVKRVVRDAIAIAEEEQVGAEEFEILLLAAWFHDVGYLHRPDLHEEEGVRIAEQFLQDHGYDEKKMAQVSSAILKTKMPQMPESHVEKMLCDADLSNLGSKHVDEIADKLRKEWEMLSGKKMSNRKWLAMNIQFKESHKFHTEGAQRLFREQKLKNIENSKIRLEELNKKRAKKKAKKKAPAVINPKRGRAVETLYRTSIPNHIRLSALADRKSNILLSISSIIISFMLPLLAPQLSENPRIVVPFLILMVTCTLTIIFAILATRPNVTKGSTSREDIQNRRSNLTFFGNFFNMDMEDFEWGMEQMVNDESFIYESMNRDLYFLGRVLAKKYKFLRIAYNIFMIGLTISMIAFSLSVAVNNLSF